GEWFGVERLAELQPEGRVGEGEEDRGAVAGLVKPVGRVVTNERRLRRIVDGHARLQGQGAAKQRGLYALPTARALAREEGRENPLGGERRRVVVGGGGPGVDRRAAGTLQRVEASECADGG